MKLSPTLAKMLNDVEYEQYENITDEEAANLSAELELAQTELAKNLEDIDTISEGIEEIEEYKKDLEVGLQSDINSTSARLLLSGLNRNIRKLDNTATVEIAGLQSDDKNAILTAGLQAADGILARAWEAVKALMSKIRDSVKKFFSKFLLAFNNTKSKAKELLEKIKKKESAGNQSSTAADNMLSESDEKEFINKFATLMYLTGGSEIKKMYELVFIMVASKNIPFPTYNSFGSLSWNDDTNYALDTDKITKNKTIMSALGFDSNAFEIKEKTKDIINVVYMAGKQIGATQRSVTDSEEIFASSISAFRAEDGTATKYRYARTALPQDILSSLEDDYKNKIKVLSVRDAEKALENVIHFSDSFTSWQKAIWKLVEGWEKDIVDVEKEKKDFTDSKKDEYLPSIKGYLEVINTIPRIAIDACNQAAMMNKNTLWLCEKTL